jgi:hypothetical protein
VPPQHLPCRFPASRWPLPASPCRPLSARAALHRRSPSQRLQRHLLLAAIPRVTSLPCRRPPDLVLSRPCIPHVHRLCPSSAAIATRAADMPAPASARPHLVLDLEHILDPLAHLFLHCTHTFSLSFFCSGHHLSPDLLRDSGSPSLASTTTPHPRSKARTAFPRSTEAH